MLNLLVILEVLLASPLPVGMEEKSAEFYFKRGVEHEEKGQYDRAITDFTKALELNPRLAKVYYKGNAYLKKGQYDKAITDFNKALELDPQYARSYLGRAIVYTMRKDYDKAWEAAHQAQRLGLQVPPDFLEELRKASGGEK